VGTLQPYYLEAQILKCSTDRFLERRSYIINGWNDCFKARLSPEDYARYTNWSWPEGMRESELPNPSETIAFGEKKSGLSHCHMDFDQGATGNDVEVVEQARHRSGSASTSGGSNYALADGSVRFFKYGAAVNPVNMWAVTEAWRAAPVKMP
jgi:prepilin-type processing-associated H-X9-DG protein